MKVYTEKEIKRAVQDVIMEGKRTCTFSHVNFIMDDFMKRLDMSYHPFWDDYEKIRGILEDFTRKPLCDNRELHKMVAGLVKFKKKHSD